MCEVQSSALEATMLTLPSSSQGQIVLALGAKYDFYPLAVEAPHILILLRSGGVVYSVKKLCDYSVPVRTAPEDLVHYFKYNVQR